MLLCSKATKVIKSSSSDLSILVFKFLSNLISLKKLKNFKVVVAKSKKI